MPYGGGPKSGCKVRARPMKLMNASDCGSIGALLMSWFHQLSDGNGRRPARSSLSWTSVEVGTAGAGVGAGAGVDTGGSVEVVGLVGVSCVVADRLQLESSRIVPIVSSRTP